MKGDKKRRRKPERPNEAGSKGRKDQAQRGLRRQGVRVIHYTGEPGSEFFLKFYISSIELKLFFKT